MLEYIKGIITENTPTYVVVEAGNLGYLINIPLSTFSRLQNCSGEIKLWLHQVIREDAWTLYGFFTTRERELFRLLIGVSGVGPGTASLILSSLSPAELELTISSGDHSRLKGVKGIGAKTAQRIIVDLKDKIKHSVAMPSSRPPTPRSTKRPSPPSPSSAIHDPRVRKPCGASLMPIRPSRSRLRSSRPSP